MEVSRLQIQYPLSNCLTWGIRNLLQLRMPGEMKPKISTAHLPGKRLRLSYSRKIFLIYIKVTPVMEQILGIYINFKDKTWIYKHLWHLQTATWTLTAIWVSTLFLHHQPSRHLHGKVREAAQQKANTKAPTVPTHLGLRVNSDSSTKLGGPDCC